jgi:hypothetical protein
MMRTRTLFSALLALALLAGAVQAQKDKDKAPAKGEDVLNVTGLLKEGDRRDRVTKHPSTAHGVWLVEGRTYTIDLKSKEFDAFLRLEDAAGKQLALDDDSGGFPNARIIFRSPKSGLYRVIVTSFDRTKGGAYTLTVRRKER